MDLTDISKASQVADAIEIPLSSPIRHAIASTVISFAQIQGTFDKDRSTFLPEHLLLLPPQTQGIPSPSNQLLHYFETLALLANKAAESLNCSSILAGQGNESDDTGDVALWLGEGDFGPGKEQNVLKLLNLTPQMEHGTQVTDMGPLSLQPVLPSILSGNPPNTPELRDLTEKINEMTNSHCFRVSSPSTAPFVIFFFLGCLVEQETTLWGGLVGIGTWSDQ